VGIAAVKSEECTLGGLTALRVGTPEHARMQVVLLHGYAMRPEDLEPFSHSLGTPALFYFPRGIQAVDPVTRAWWPIDEERRSQQLAIGARDLFQESPPGRAAARAALCAFLDAVRSQAPELPLVLGGFSQGGMLACDTVLCERQAVSGLVMLSSSRIAFDEWLANRDPLSGLPVLVSHGQHDTDLAFGAGEALRDFFRSAQAKVTWQPFDGGHDIPLVVWRSLRRFLAELARKTD
jgi:phospholipase/carboxylesterase